MNQIAYSVSLNIPTSTKSYKTEIENEEKKKKNMETLPMVNI